MVEKTFIFCKLFMKINVTEFRVIRLGGNRDNNVGCGLYRVHSFTDDNIFVSVKLVT